MNHKEIAFYEKLAAENRGTTRQVGWGSEYTQGLRFQVLCEVGSHLFTDEQRKSARIVDLGCGRGDLVAFLRKAGFSGHYLGIDGVSANVEDGIKAYADATTEFKLMNWDGVSSLEKVWGPVDIFFVSGAFGATEPARRNRFLMRMLTEHARLGVVTNFLRETDRISDYGAEAVLTDPSEVVRLLDPSVFRFLVRGDYLWNDFTVGISRWS
jgi:hypothetical protein